VVSQISEPSTVTPAYTFLFFGAKKGHAELLANFYRAKNMFFQ